MLNDATLRQIEAADPGANTWLSANAGSGKTRVLTDRVARLLLAGVSPQNILCLTYTKAAASEMQNRLFKRLGEWAMKPDDKLRDELAELGVTEAPDLSLARQLFARAIETPGGLKIQTIHSFCAAILRRFPLEAGVSPQFQEMDDRAARILQEEVIDDLAQGQNRPAVARLAAFYTGEDFARLAQEIAGKRDAFRAPADTAAIWQAFGLEPGFDRAALEALAFGPGDAKLIADLIPVLAAGSSTEQKAAVQLATIPEGQMNAEALPILEGVFLTGKGAKDPFSAKIGSFPTKATREGAALPLMPALEGLMGRVEGARLARIRLYSARKALALHDFAHLYVRKFEARKQARGWLDFDDLITLAGALLTDPAVASWVLFRLDGGIDHILVDEAQDTSPAQWRVIERLAREFTTGESARENRNRTIFVVGDQKQSIYSFQGADPAGFTRMRDSFDKAFQEVGRRVKALELEYSFRSARAILSLVDTTLAELDGLGDAFKHLAFNGDRAGRVDLWPVVETGEAPEEKDWHDPVDSPSPESAQSILADAIADQIANLLKTGSIPDGKDGFRRIRAGDIMVLVRRRSGVFHPVIRACKARGLPIAGADRLRIGAELAVMDLTALLSFLATPEDDLSLAAVLRSPLFGFSEDQLFRLAQGRGRRYLWAQLREMEDVYPKTLEILNDLRREADFLRPYDLIDRLLTRHDGRRKLIARLGAEALDGIDSLLSQALAYEHMEVPSLTGFLTWLAADEVEIKRQMDSAGDQIRVMTVHGSKGLEAPVVILPDCTKPRANPGPQVIEMEQAVAWRPPSEDLPPELDAIEAARKLSEREEWTRLLYVAMTRAESWLIVAAAGDVGKEEGDSWYRLVEGGMLRAGAEKHAFELGQGLRLQTGTWEAAQGDVRREARESVTLPGWTAHHATRPPEPPKVLTPSDLGGAKIAGWAEGGDDSEEAMARGRKLHRLLEFLPAYPHAAWPATAEALLAHGEDAASPEEAAQLLQEVSAILMAAELQPIFAPGTLAEVEITAPTGLPKAPRLHGIIDRLIVTEDEVLAVDFKSNRVVPPDAERIPEGILRQLGAYEHALAQVYPGRAIRSAVLWTATATLMRLPDGLALRAFGRLDADEPHT